MCPFARFVSAHVSGLGVQLRKLKSFGAERVFEEQASSQANRPVLKVCLGFW